MALIVTSVDVKWISIFCNQFVVTPLPDRGTPLLGSLRSSHHLKLWFIYIYFIHFAYWFSNNIERISCPGIFVHMMTFQSSVLRLWNHRGAKIRKYNLNKLVSSRGITERLSRWPFLSHCCNYHLINLWLSIICSPILLFDCLAHFSDA